MMAAPLAARWRQGMGKRGLERGRGLLDAGGAAREVDNQGGPPDPSQAPRKHPKLGVGLGGTANAFSDWTGTGTRK
jgi:hypothetical protein